MLTLSFGFACVPDDASSVVVALAYYMFFPAWIAVFATLQALIDQRRYFGIAGLALHTISFVYFQALAHTLAVDRPAEYDWTTCRATRYAFPDPTFVSSLAYAIVVGIGLLRDRVHGGWLTTLTLYSAPVLYVAACVATHYLSPLQAAANLSVVALTSMVFLFTYQLFDPDGDRFFWRSNDECRRQRQHQQHGRQQRRHARRARHVC